MMYAAVARALSAQKQTRYSQKWCKRFRFWTSSNIHIHMAQWDFRNVYEINRLRYKHILHTALHRLHTDTQFYAGYIRKVFQLL